MAMKRDPPFLDSLGIHFTGIMQKPGKPEQGLPGRQRVSHQQAVLENGFSVKRPAIQGIAPVQAGKNARQQAGVMQAVEKF